MEWLHPSVQVNIILYSSVHLRCRQGGRGRPLSEDAEIVLDLLLLLLVLENLPVHLLALLLEVLDTCAKRVVSGTLLPDGVPAEPRV